GSNFPISLQKCRGEEKISRHPLFISGSPAVCTGPSLTIAEKIPNNSAAPSWQFPQLAHFVERRPPVPRKHY
ncbi:MAG: hypothetical protein WB689_38795, partial [Xanthobacteraceae bacterium]